MSISSAHLHWVFGLRTDVCGNVAFYDAHHLMYLAGGTLIFYNIDQNLQRIMPLSSDKGRTFTSVAFGPYKQHLATGDRGDREKNEKPTVTIYETQTGRKKKVLGPLDIVSDEVVWIEFSSDSKCLAIQGGSPDWTMSYFQWETNKLLGVARTANPPATEPIYQIKFKPEDARVVSVVGGGVFVQFRLMDGSLRAAMAPKPGAPHYTCHAWLGSKLCAVGTMDGVLLVYEGLELRFEFNLGDYEVPSVESSVSVLVGQSRSEGAATVARVAVSAITGFTKGFACAWGLGIVTIFEKTGSRDMYRMTREIRIPQDPYSVIPSRSGDVIILNLIFSPTEEQLICSAADGNLYEYIFSSSSLRDDKGTFLLVQNAAHSGAVTGMDICIRKPLAVTCSSDKSIRLWNFETRQLELHKFFNDEPLSVAIHPTGLFLLVTFSDNVHLMNILIDDVSTFKEYPLRHCREVSFSHGGHFFAIVYGNLIQTYSATTFDLLANYRGHDGRVTNVIWSPDDTSLVSAGMDGAVYEWDVMTGKRLSENIIKGCGYTGVTISPDGKQLFATGNDRMMKELLDSQIYRLIDCKEVLTCIYVSVAGRTMFAGTAGGAVRSIKFPFSLPITWVDFPAHSAPVVKLRVTYDEQYLISVSEDGCVILWKVTDKEGAALLREKKLVYSNEILITKTELEEKNALTAELKSRVVEMATENQYQLRQRDVTYNARIKELSDQLLLEMDELRKNNQNLKNEKDRAELVHNDLMVETENKHAKLMQDQDLINRKKLVLEYETYQELESKSQFMQADLERQIGVMIESKETAIETLTDTYEGRIADLAAQLRDAEEQLKLQAVANEKEQLQLEIDVDEEVLAVKAKYELLLKEERDKMEGMKLDVLAMRKKETKVGIEAEERKEELRRSQREVSRLTQACRNLNAEISQLKKERLERDEIIQDKEKRVYELRKMNQDLEKYRYVMDHKIGELQNYLEVKENRVKCLNEQTEAMQKDLLMFQSQFDKWERDSVSWKQKLEATENSNAISKQKAHESGIVLHRIKVDLHSCIGYLQDPKQLKESITEVYHRYVTQADLRGEVKFDVDVETEYIAQKEHLERTVVDKQNKLTREIKDHMSDNFKVMQENGLMHLSINELRRELVRERIKVADLMTALGVHGSGVNVLSGPELFAQIARTAKNAELERQLHEANRQLDLQRHDIAQLQRDLCDAEEREMRAAEAVAAAALQVASSAYERRPTEYPE